MVAGHESPQSQDEWRRLNCLSAAEISSRTRREWVVRFHCFSRCSSSLAVHREPKLPQLLGGLAPKPTWWLPLLKP